jgi:1-acyl-sn-glycerol-3-phosphate acyltransferase
VQPRAADLAPIEAIVQSRAFRLAQRALHVARDRIDETATRMLGRDFEDRLDKVQRYAGESGIDPFGLDPGWAKYAIGVAALFHRFWFRTEVEGIENVPRGRVLLVANHSGQIPIDAMVIGAAMFLDTREPRVVRSMVEKWVQTLPFVSLAFHRVGQVLGTPDNARRLLALGESLLVFPEGVRGISKPFKDRYRLAPFGHGFLRLALEMDTPIVPVSVIGAEEQYVSLGNLDGLARLFRVPALPLIPQLLLPGGQLPLPVKYRLIFGEPLRFEGDHDDDDTVIGEKVAVVRAAIERQLRDGLARRRSVFFG